MNRRELLKLGAVTIPGLAMAAQAAGNSASNVSATRSSGAGSCLIKNVTILSMDPELGDITGGSVFIEDGVIKAIGSKLPVTADEVVDGKGGILLPGFVDGHRHHWQTALRNQHDVWGYANYLREGINRHAVCFTPKDMYISSYAGALESLNAGVTSVLDYCHNTRSPEHAEASARAAIESGIGGYFCYSLADTPSHGPGDTVDLSKPRVRAEKDPDWRYSHYLALRDKYFSDSKANMRLGLATSYLEMTIKSQPDLAAKEINFARKVKADMISIHVHNSEGDRLVPFLERQGLLTDNMLLAHANGVKPEEYDLLKKHGVSISVTPESEIPYGEYPAYWNARDHGVKYSLGADSVIFNGGDMFQPMRMTLQMQRYGESKRREEGEDVPVTQVRDMLAAATIEGAKALNIDDRVGSITPGKQADLVLIGSNNVYAQPVSNPVSTVIFNSSVSDISDVWVSGKRVKQNGKLSGIDFSSVNKALAESRDKVVARAKTIRFINDDVLKPLV